MAPLAAVLSLAGVLTGCVDEPIGDTSGSEPSDTETADSTTTDASASYSGTGVIDPETGAFETTAGDTDDAADDSDSGAGFIYGTPDGGPPGYPCDIFQHDCPEGEKCMPWAPNGGAWDATRCSPIADDPGQPGDPCTVEGSGVSGVDDCDLGAMCWDIDSETLTGTCIAMCTGDPANPVCVDPSTTCSITNDGVLVVCLPVCDPILQDCVEGQACYANNADFICIPDASGELGAYGDGCESINVCDPGLVCVVPEVVPGCVGSQGCCSEVCSLSDPAGDAQCTGAPEGQTCQPWYAEDQAPPEYVDVGVCALPL